jgi:uncharacterized protein (DUF433 family)
VSFLPWSMNETNVADFQAGVNGPGLGGEITAVGLLSCCRRSCGAGSSEQPGDLMTTYGDRIVMDPAICHGRPVVRGLRYPVETILDLLSSGMTHEEILMDYADLEREDILAVLEYAARLSRTKRIDPRAA